MNAIVLPPWPPPKGSIAGRAGNAILTTREDNPMATELHDLPIAELSDQIVARKPSPVELVEALIQPVQRYDGQTRAFITRTFDLARRQARPADADNAAAE